MYEETLFDRQVKLFGLDVPDTWKGDPRTKMISLFSPIIENTEFSFKINTTDTSGKILELYRERTKRRVMGIAGKRDMQVGVFFNADFFDSVKNIAELPENQRPNKTQPHMKISLRKTWNVLCAATGKLDLLA